jgi:CheY-like chemotaxis protein
MNFLVVDDNKFQRQILSYIIKSCSPEDVWIDTAEDGYEAIYKAGTNHYDFILMDLTMPHCDGLTATKAIRDFSKNIIVVVTAYGTDPQIVRSCEKSGANGFILKPMTRQSFQKMIKYFQENKSFTIFN